MVTEDAYNRVLEYLKNHDHINTFRLARELNIDRHKILNIIKKLEEKQAVEFKSGTVKFLKFLKREEKPIKVKKTISTSERETEPKVKKAAQRSVKFQEKLKALGSLQYENKKLTGKLSELEASIKRQHYTKTRKFREQDELIEKLENRLKASQEKAKIKPKIVIRKIEVPKIITKTIVKRVIKKVPVEVIKKVPVRMKEREAKRFKLPEFNVAWMKNIQQLEKPDFLEQKIRTGKFNFSGLNKNVQQLHIPGILKNN